MQKTNQSNENTLSLDDGAKIKKNKVWVKYCILAIVVLLSVAGFYGYVKYTEIYPSTDDAYVNANIIRISTQASGRIDQLYIQNNQTVKKGALLFKLEDKSFIFALQKAKSGLTLAQNEMPVIQDLIKLNEAKLKQDQARYALASKKAERMMKLSMKGMVSTQSLDEAKANLDIAKADMSAVLASIAQQHKQLTLQRSKINAEKANVAIEQLNLAHTKIYAPMSGFITNLSLNKGALVLKDRSLFALVSNNQFWIDANYKETQIKNMKVGQKATVVLDMYPGVTLHGKIKSISEGTGSLFSLLPPENASGNWVKVTQRFPVRIFLNKNESQKVLRLRVGASVSVQVDTKS